MLELNELTHRYINSRQPVTALDAVSLSVQPGQLVLVRGTSGSGKSTLLFAAGGMRRPTAGRVQLDGQDLYGLSRAARASLRGSSMGFIFQSLNLIPYLNALENVLLAAGEDAASLKSRGVELLEELGLSDRLHHRVDRLSQGERQRAAVARAMLRKPSVLLADEPTGNLDPENADTVFHALRRYADQGGAVLLVSHATSHTQLADHVYTLDQGRITTAETAALITN